MRNLLLSRQLTSLSLAALVCIPVFALDSAEYSRSVEQWRQEYSTKLTSDTGWLTVSGLFWLKVGENRFGANPKNDIVLPASAPDFAGVFDFHAGKISVRILPGVQATMNGKPVQAAELRPDSKEDWLMLGDLILYVHASGPRMSIRLRDKNSAVRKSFTGLKWFPIDESFRALAKYTPYNPPKELDSENILGDPIKMKILGFLTFTLKGQNIRLEAGPDDAGTGLFIVFRDLTSGKETYPASRFLDAAAPTNGSVELDFNKAYNPPCAYNPFTTCPLPLPGNRLHIRIPVGEKLYKHGH